MDAQSFLNELDDLFEFDPGTITAAEALQELPGWSSLTFMGLIALIDEELGITLAPDTILGCQTVGDLLREVGLTLSDAPAQAA